MTPMFASMSRMTLGLVAVAAIQLGVLGWMVWDRIALLKHGREITLPIIPVDPRDLFKGDYVRLAFPVSRVPASVIEGERPAANTRFFVTLEKKADGEWVPVKLAGVRSTDANPDRITLEARTRYSQGAGPTFDVVYGIERYYVPEGKGLVLEDMARDKKLAVVLAVDAKGRAAIKGLVIDGKRVYDEPLL